VANDAHRSQLTADFARAGDGVGFPGPGKKPDQPHPPSIFTQPKLFRRSRQQHLVEGFQFARKPRLKREF